jgi:hypothetical protein
MDGVQVEQGNLVVRLCEGARGKAYWDAQWRYRTAGGEWRLKKRSLGLAWLDERAANVAAVAAMEQYAVELAELERRSLEAAEHRVTVRELAH